jgi:hypothetical protein
MTGNRRWMLAGVVAVVAVVGFLLFRPDTLFTDVEASESLDDAFAGTTTSLGESTTTSLVDSPTTTEVATTRPATEPTTSVGPVPVSAGQLFGIDHAAEGTATVYQQDGRFVLRLEDDTDIQNGPDLYVWVLPSTSYGGGSPTEFIDLGTLKGTVGGQNYELSADFDPELHRTVLIWCLRFAVPFAAAELG